MFNTIAYRGCFINLHTSGNVETVRVVYARPDGTTKIGPTCYTLHGAKLFITRRFNRAHAEALLIDALRDIKARRPNFYQGENATDRATLHHAVIQDINRNRNRS